MQHSTLKRYIKQVIMENKMENKRPDTLRQYIKSVIAEAGEDRFMKSLDEPEQKAKAWYETALDQYTALKHFIENIPDGVDPGEWRKSEKKKGAADAFEALVRDSRAAGAKAAYGVPDASKSSFNPPQTTEAGVAKWKDLIKKYEDELEFAMREYAQWDRSILRGSRLKDLAPLPPRSSKKKASTASDVGEESVETKEFEPGEPMIEWNGGEPFVERWTNWPKDIRKLSGVGFGKQKKDAEGATERGEVMGTGPGEKWLAFVFGGKVMGGGVSWDIEIGSTKCESKELESASSLIRPGTEGMRAFEPAKELIDSVMRPLRVFKRQFEKVGQGMDKEDPGVGIAWQLVDFVDENYSEIMGKGEISIDRFSQFRNVMRLVNKLKDMKGVTKAKEKSAEKPTIKFSTVDKAIPVKKPTYINVIQTVKDEEADVPEDLLKGESEWTLLLSGLKDEVFSDPDGWITKMYKAVSLNEVFAEVNGLFIVNELKGFCWIPKPKLGDNLVFNSVSQGKPKFRFVHFNDYNEFTFEEALAGATEPAPREKPTKSRATSTKGRSSTKPGKK